MICTNITPVAYQQSKWVAAWLPIQYNIHSYKWPENSIDTVDTIYTISDEYGFARVVLTGTTETYVAKEYIKISGSAVDAYNGVWQIRTVNSSTDLVLTAPYVSNASGSFQRYYNNYNVVINVYTGIRSGHVLAADRPMALRGQIKVKPDSNNDAVITISDYVRNDISPIDNKLCECLPSGLWYGNDTNQFTQFYIAYAESYDTSDGSSVSTYTSSFINDQSEPDVINIFSASNSVQQFQYFQGKSMGEYAVADIDPEANPAKFMTPFAIPTYFSGYEADASIIIAYTSDDLDTGGFDVDYLLNQYDSSGTLVATETGSLTLYDEGVYRFAWSERSFNSSTDTFIFKLLKSSDSSSLSEQKTFKYDQTTCGKSPLYLRWINRLGGWDSWLFPRHMDREITVGSRDTIRRNVFQSWDNYFSRTGTTEDDYIRTEAFENRTIRSQRLTTDEADGMREIKTSPKVQEVFQDNSVSCGNWRHRTVLIDNAALPYRTDRTNFHEYVLNFRYSDQIQTQGQ